MGEAAGKAGAGRWIAGRANSEGTAHGGRRRWAGKTAGAVAVSVEIPGEILAPAYGVRLRVEPAGGGQVQAEKLVGKTATLRNWKPGDRVRIRYSGGAKKVKEVLERMKITGDARTFWPVLEVEGRIVWMRGVAVEPGPERVTELQDADTESG